MSFPTTDGKSMDVPSRYEAFENEVNRASSPQRRRLSIPNRHVRATKIQKVSDVAVAGESPNLKDVASTNSSKAAPSDSTEVRPQTSRIRPVEIQLTDNSATPSIDHLLQIGAVTSTQTKSSKNIIESTVNLLMTQSIHEESPLGDYGEANALRLPSSSESELCPDDLAKKLPRSVQREISLRRTLEWMEGLPSQPPNDGAVENECSLESTISKNAPQNDSVRTSVIVVSPDPMAREVHILLQRLNPQMLLKVPVHDIQDQFKQKQCSLSSPEIQKVMNTLITSAKLGLVPFHQKSAKRLAVPSSAKEKTTNANGEGVSSSFLLRGKSKKKRKLLNLERQPSNISEVIEVDTNNLTPVECPYSPPPTKARKPTKKQNAPGKVRKPPPVLPMPRNKKVKPPSVPKTRENDRKTPQSPPQKRVTRSSIRSSINLEREQNVATASQENTSECSSDRHEMTLNRKPSRRTSHFFQPKTQPTRQATKKKTPTCKKRFQIVGTFLHREEMEIVLKAAKKLGGSIENKVSASTTHVVCGGPKRTLNVLRGISRGCWILTHEWVIQSMERGKWIDEEPFELTTFSPAVQKCRVAKQTLGIYPSIFKTVGGIYVGPQTVPPKKDLCELLKLCGGKIFSTTNRASVSVGVFVPGRVCVTELWVLDSIQESILLPHERYKLPSNE